MSESRGWTRREALGILGMGVATAALPEFASAAPLTFPKGAVIRTILKDYAPEELAGGATLFHEHMSFADNFMTRWTGYAADSRRENAMPGAPPPGATGGAGRQGGATPAPPPSTPPPEPPEPTREAPSRARPIDDDERTRIEQALRQHGGNVAATARALKESRYRAVLPSNRRPSLFGGD